MDASLILNRLVDFQNLSQEETYKLFLDIMEGKISPTLTGAILTALRMKGETKDEIVGAAKAMREKSLKVPLKEDIRRLAIDTCGTGGDKKGTFNISTAVAFVVASAGIPVAKHGNRSVSSKIGSADILEALGIKIDLSPEKVAECIEKANFGFIFAPKFHLAMKNVVPVRRELKIRTIFNMLGPLTNPANVEKQLLGVYSKLAAELLAESLIDLGVNRACVVHGEDGLDEISVCAPTYILEVNDGNLESYFISPTDFGFPSYTLEDIKAKDTLEENKKLFEDLLSGKLSKCGILDAVAINSAFAFKVAGKVDNAKEGLELAYDLINEGKPYEVLEKVREISNS